MSNHDPCDHNPELIRKHEAALATLATTIKDFMDRYDVDREACAERYSNDRGEAREFRERVLVKFDRVEDSIRNLDAFVQELRPNYKRILTFAGIIVFGSMGIIWKMIWDHVSGGR